MAPLIRDIALNFLDSFASFRTVRNILADDYTPAYRILSYFVLFMNCSFALYLFSFRGVASRYSILFKNLFGIFDFDTILFLFSWFSVSLFSYWLFQGLGSSARVLVHPVWITLYLVVGFLLRLTFNLIKLHLNDYVK